MTSPGGTTASALYELEKGGYRTVVADAGGMRFCMIIAMCSHINLFCAVWAAYRRSLELGNEDSNVGPGRSKM